MITQLYDRSNRKLVLLYPTFNNEVPKCIENVMPEAVQSIVNIHNVRFIYRVLSNFLSVRKSNLMCNNKLDSTAECQIKTIEFMLARIQEQQLAKVVTNVTSKQLTLYALAPPSHTNFYSDFITKVFPVIQWCEQMASTLQKTPLKRNPCQGRQG